MALDGPEVYVFPILLYPYLALTALVALITWRAWGLHTAYRTGQTELQPVNSLRFADCFYTP